MGLVRVFLWIHLVGALIVEVLATMGRLLVITYGDEPLRPDQVIEIAFLIPGMILLGVLLPEAAPILMEPRRAAVARMPASPKIRRYALGAVASFLGQAGAALWSTYQHARWDAESIGLALLPLTLCILITGCCLLLVHFAKLHGQGR